MIIDPAADTGATSYRWLTNCVVPRPIAFVSTISTAGILNLAPFSFFNAICGEPPMVCFAPSHRTPPKDTLVNVKATGEFVVNMVSDALAAQMNETSALVPPEVDEFALAGLTPVPSAKVRPPRVGECLVSLECEVRQIIELSTKPDGGTLVIGEVVMFHVADELLVDGRIDSARLDAIGRMGGPVYTRTRDVFSMRRPAGAQRG